MSSSSLSSSNTYDLALQKSVFEYHFLPYFPLRKSLLMCGVSTAWNTSINKIVKKSMLGIVDVETLIKTNGVPTLKAGIDRIAEEIRQLKKNGELKFEICMPLNRGCHFKGMIKLNAQHRYPSSFDSQFNCIKRKIVLVLEQSLPSVQPLETYLQDIEKLTILSNVINGIKESEKERFPLFDRNIHTKGINLRLSAIIPPPAFAFPIESTTLVFKKLRTPDGRSFEEIQDVPKKPLLFSKTDQASMQIISKNFQQIAEENSKPYYQAIGTLKEAAIEQMNNQFMDYQFDRIWRNKIKLLGLATLILLVSLMFFTNPTHTSVQPQPLLPPSPHQRDPRFQKLINEIHDPATKLKQFELLISDIQTELQNMDLSYKSQLSP